MYQSHSHSVGEPEAVINNIPLRLLLRLHYPYLSLFQWQHRVSQEESFCGFICPIFIQQCGLSVREQDSLISRSDFVMLSLKSLLLLRFPALQTQLLSSRCVCNLNRWISPLLFDFFLLSNKSVKNSPTNGKPDVGMTKWNCPALVVDALAGYLNRFHLFTPSSFPSVCLKSRSLVAKSRM